MTLNQENLMKATPELRSQTSPFSKPADYACHVSKR